MGENLRQEDFDETEVIEQNLALANLFKGMLLETKHHLNKLYLLLIVSLLSNLVIIGSFLWYNSHMSTEVETVTETTTTQTVDGENSQINNVKGNQYNDESTHNEATSEEVQK